MCEFLFINHSNKFGFKKTIQSKNGTKYIVFRGYSGLRKYLNATTYKTSNKTVAMLSGVSEIAYDIKNSSGNSLVKSALKQGGNIFKTGVKGSPFGVVLVVTFDVLEWLADSDSDKRFTDLLGQIGSDILKSIGAGIIGVAAGVVVAAAGFGALAVIAVCAIVMIVSSFVFEKLDAYLGMTTNIKHLTTKSYDWLVAEIKSIWTELESSFDKTFLDIQKETSNEYQEISRLS